MRGGTRGNRNAWETGATTRGYEVSEDGRRVSQLVRLTESTPSSRKSFHGLSDTTTSDLHKSQPYSDLLRQTLGFSVPRPVVTVHDLGSLGLSSPRSTSASTRLASRSRAPRSPVRDPPTPCYSPYNELPLTLLSDLTVNNKHCVLLLRVSVSFTKLLS